MDRNKIMFFVFVLVLLLVIGSFTFLNVSGSRAVNYTMKITDPSGDSGTLVGSDQGTRDDGDILEISSAKSGDNVELKMKVKGKIRYNNLSFSAGYTFHLDIDGDGDEDWFVTTSSSYAMYGNNTMLIDDTQSNSMYLANATGDGTDTLTVLLPISYITQYETIYSWNMYGQTSITHIQLSTVAIDFAPDGEEFPKDEGDNDEDGMPNWYEAEKNFDPNNASDADADADEDGYTNKEEYDAGTNPWSASDKPGAAELTVTILNPKENEKIPPGGISDYYLINGTAAAKTGDPIDHIEYRVVEAMNSDWQWVSDDSEFYDYSEWSSERETATFMGTSAYWAKGKNTIEVKAFAESGENKTVSVTVYFNSDEPTNDTDSDSIPDDYEDDNGLDKNDPTDASKDKDGDSYSNFIEYDKGTDPQDPNDYPGAGNKTDTDGDNTPDETDTDDDDDGMPDAWEDIYDFDPLDASDAYDDSDGDGYDNLEEYDEGTNPRDPTDYPDEPSDLDPAKETPTDLQIEVDINKAEFSFKEKDNKIDFKVHISGTTSGAKNVELALVGYYKDGTHDDVFWVEAFDWTDNAFVKQMLENLGYSEMYFKATSDNWKTWEYKFTGSVEITNETEDIQDMSDQTDEFSRMVVYARAYSDEDAKNWNQDSKQFEGFGSTDKKKDDSSTPGFEALFLVVALAITFIIYRRRRH
jgi:hypothetical protein